MSSCGSCAPPAADADCLAGEVFALQVLGDDMAPEFRDGEVVIVEPDGALRDGSFVIARSADGWTLRQLRARGPAWVLCALREGLPEWPLASLADVRGVVIQKAVPGRRRLSTFYR